MTFLLHFIMKVDTILSERTCIVSERLSILDTKYFDHIHYISIALELYRKTHIYMLKIIVNSSNDYYLK